MSGDVKLNEPRKGGADDDHPAAVEPVEAFLRYARQEPGAASSHRDDGTFGGRLEAAVVAKGKTLRGVLPALIPIAGAFVVSICLLIWEVVVTLDACGWAIDPIADDCSEIEHAMLDARFSTFWSTFLVVQVSMCVAAILIYCGHYYRTRSWPGRTGVRLVILLTVFAAVGSVVAMYVTHLRIQDFLS